MRLALTAHPAIVAAVLACGIVGALCIAYDPRFETNDDVAMSMIAHGYGDSTYGSPLLIYSNVLWGYVVRATPTINGLLGYSVATLAVLLAAGWAIVYFLQSLDAGNPAGFLVAAVILARPTVIPQFTLGAGILAAAAVIGWQAYARRGGAGTLAASCALSFFGFLVREPEWALVTGVALPLLPWRALKERRETQVAFAALGLAIGVASVMDRVAYRGSDWERYFEIKKAVTAVATWGYGQELKKHPDILSRHGYTANDIALIENAFWADPEISDPVHLNAMMAEAGGPPLRAARIWEGMAELRVLAGRVMLPLMLPALVLLFLGFRWPVALAWVLCLASVVAIAVSGRPGIVRVYVPLGSLLLAAPLAAGTHISGLKRWLVLLTLCGAVAGNAYALVPEASASSKRVRDYRRDLHAIPPQTIVNWANSLRHEYPYSVLARDPTIRSLRLFDVSAFAFAPFSVAMAERAAGRGIREGLQSAEGIAMFTPYSYLWEQLRIYCGERLKGQLRGDFSYVSPSVTVQRVRCARTE